MNPNHDGPMGTNFPPHGQVDAFNFNPLAALQASNIFAQQPNGFPSMMNTFPPQMQNNGPSNGNWAPPRSQSPISMQQFPPALQQAHPQSQQHQAHMHRNGGANMNGGPGLNANHWMSQNQAPTGMNLASLIPVNNILTDAMRMMVPVGSSPDDEKILIRALLDSSSRGQTYKQALDSLHGINNHASNLWKDYYLDHKHRIDDIIRRQTSPPVPHGPSRHHSQPSTSAPLILPQPQPPHRNGVLPSPHGRQPPFPTPVTAPLPRPLPPLRASSSQSDVKPKVAKKPTFSPAPSDRRASIRREGSVVSGTSSSRRSRAKKPASSASSSSASTVENKSYSYTSTRYVSSSANLPNLFPNYADIKIPDPPSRSPSPPTNIVPAPGGKGNRYTAEDKAYFPRKVAWEIKCNSRATKNEILQKIADRAPHHSIQSWRAHWHDNPIADKILASVASQLSSSDDGSGDEDADGEDDDEAAPSASEYEDKSIEDDDGDDDWDVPVDEDEGDMGEPGESYTKGDQRILARYIASRGDAWKDMTRQEKFGPFIERYPGRSIASWAEYFRRSEKDVMRYARKYLSNSKKGPSPSTAAKRRASDREDNDDQRSDKRPREDAPAA